MRRLFPSLLAMCALGALASAAAADPVVYKACPGDKIWSDAANGCVCAPPRTWSDTSKSCVTDASAESRGKAEPKPPPPPKPTDAGPTVSKREAGAATHVDASPSTDGGPKSCPPGREWKDAFGGCVPICERGYVLDFYGRACHPIRVR